MATFLRPLGIVLRNHVFTYNIKSRSCKDKLLRTQQFLYPDHLKKGCHSVCITSRKDLKAEDLARPASGYILFSRSMAENGVYAKKLKASPEMAEFDALFPELVEDLTKNQIGNPELADAFKRFKEVLLYNVPSGKKLKGLSVVTSYEHLVPGASEADLKIARVLGWCVELFQAFYLMIDDVMDNSQTRRGQLCWYKKDKVGLTALNDAFFLECCIYSLLRKYIRNKPYYVSIMEVFLQAIMKSVIGQCLDITTSESQGDLSQFTMERFNAVAKWKTTYFVFYLPVATAMHMAGISDEENHKQVMPLLFLMAQLHQAHNDYLDCYGDPGVTRKIGNDIEENKCSWLIVKALEIASDEQKQELRWNYGKCDKEAVEKVKAIYRDLKLEDVYKQHEESSYQDISNLINSLDCAVPKEVFLDLTITASKRDK